jgi:hypothetical protein
MSERLLFELKAVDNATAPLRQVQNELQRTAGVAGSATKDFRKFALGGLQQAGFQIGDFAVQLANGTNAMQAFGQQAPQFLQIFGPIGSLAGAAIAVFAAFAVIMEKTKGKVSNYADALKNLTEEIRKNQDAALMAKFGTDIPAVANAKQVIKDLQDQIKTISLGGGYGAGTASAIQGRNEMRANAKKISDLQIQLAVLVDQQNVQSILNGYLSVGGGLQRAAVLSKQEELRALKEGKKLLLETLSKYTDIGSAIKSASEVDLASVFSDAISPSNVLYQFAKKTLETMVTMSNLPLQDFLLKQRIDAGMKGRGLPADTYGMTTAPIDTGRLFKNIEFGSTGAAIKPEDKNKTGGGASTDAMKTLRDQLELEVRLLGKSEAQQRVIQALGEDWKKYSSEAISGLVDQINSMDELNRVAEMQKQIADSIKSSMEDAFMGIVDGTSSVKDAFRSMAADIIKELYRVLVVQQLVGQIGTATQAGTGLLGGIGRLFGMRAMGGPVTGGKPYMVGERGPEIVVPSRNGNVIPNNQLGGGGVTVVQNINITTGVQQTVRAEIRSLMPQIADSAKRAVLDAKQRGGSYGSAFA